MHDGASSYTQLQVPPLHATSSAVSPLALGSNKERWVTQPNPPDETVRLSVASTVSCTAADQV